MAATKTFDIECYRLACHFLDDCANVIEADRCDLASAIQQCIEDWLEDRDNEQESALDLAAERDGDEARDLGYASQFAIYRMYRGKLQHQLEMARRFK